MSTSIRRGTYFGTYNLADVQDKRSRGRTASTVMLSGMMNGRQPYVRPQSGVVRGSVSMKRTKNSRRPRSAVPCRTNSRMMEMEEDAVYDTKFVTKGALTRRYHPNVADMQHKFEISPDFIDMGKVPLGGSQSSKLVLRNIGNVTNRFRLLPFEGCYFRTVYENGATVIAPGLASVVEVHVLPRELGVLKDVLEIHAGDDVFRVPVKANVIREEEFQEYLNLKKEASGLSVQMDLIPRVPFTYWDSAKESLIYEGPVEDSLNLLMFDASVSVDEIEKRHKEALLARKNRPLPPCCERIYCDIRGDEIEDKNSKSMSSSMRSSSAILDIDQDAKVSKASMPDLE